MVREKFAKENVTTLAIGDGANDVNMITAAHVGIGIRGLEGQQAARSSDFAICQFKHLKNLMFVHGREAYRRNSYLVLYIFYKNVLYVLPLFYYGMFSCFSGTTFYDGQMYQAFNIFFTGMPVCWYCTYDFAYSKDRFLHDPSLYKIGLKNKCFNRFVFWQWYTYGIW